MIASCNKFTDILHPRHTQSVISMLFRSLRNFHLILAAVQRTFSVASQNQRWGIANIMVDQHLLDDALKPATPLISLLGHPVLFYCKAITYFHTVFETFIHVFPWLRTCLRVTCYSSHSQSHNVSHSTTSHQSGCDRETIRTSLYNNGNKSYNTQKRLSNAFSHIVKTFLQYD